MTKDEEVRLRKVEDAIISFDNIAKIVIVDIKERVKTLEAHDDEFSKIMYASCDLKTKEIETKIKESEQKIYPSIRRGRTSVMLLVAGMFGLFVGAVVYFNGQIGNVHEKINTALKESAKNEGANSADIKSVLNELKYIRETIDTKVHTHP